MINGTTIRIEFLIRSKPYKDKFTLFWYEEDFADSKNEGFLHINLSETPEFKIRYRNEIFNVKFDENDEVIGEKKYLELKDIDKIFSILKSVYINHSYLLHAK